MKKFNIRFYLFISSILFILIIYKVIHVPITHDEVATIFLATDSSIWSILMYDIPIPNNHILNTILTKISLSLFGTNHFSVRLPSLLSFIIYCYAVYSLLNKTINLKSWLFIPASLFFVSNPYLLDFFGLTRGYSLAVSLSLLSISYLLSAFKNSNSMSMKWSVLLAALSCYANFTLLYYFLTVLTLTVLFFIIQYREGNWRKKDALQILTGLLLFILLIIPPIARMDATNQFKYWSGNGFIEETFKPLITHTLYSSKVLFFQSTIFFQFLVITVVLLVFFWSILQVMKIENKLSLFKNPLFVAFFILIGTVLINLLHVYLTDKPNLKNRTALFYYPMFITVFVFAISSIDFAIRQWMKISLSIIVTLLCVLQMSLNIELGSVREWSYDQNTIEVIKIIGERTEKKVILSTDWMFNPSFYYYSQTDEMNGIELSPYSKELLPHSPQDFYYIFEKDSSLFQENYTIIKRFNNRTLLLEVKAIND